MSRSEIVGQLKRSRRMVQEVCNRNQGGQVPVYWMAILGRLGLGAVHCMTFTMGIYHMNMPLYFD